MIQASLQKTVRKTPSGSEIRPADANGIAPPAPAPRLPRWKRPLDVVLVVISLPLFLPVAMLIALGIKVVSPGPVFFPQVRIGYRGRRFTCWKYRSMKTTAGDGDGVHREHTTQLMRNGKTWSKMDASDPRVVPLGRLLRASGLDELPQLYNVLRGDMSLVGPRPGTPYEFEAYEPWQKERLECLPGLTGLWQVSGRNRATFVQMVHLDIHYARNMSFARDLQIIVKTLPTLVEQVVTVLRKKNRRV